MTPEEARDRDETRRLLYTALVAIRSGRTVSAELAGTIVNALVHHSRLATRPYAIELGEAILRLDGTVVPVLQKLIDWLDD